MKLNTLLLTSAATLMATSVAFAADLPSKKAAPAAGSVQVCKVGGMTGFTLPGSDTCLQISGRVTVDVGNLDIDGQDWFGDNFWDTAYDDVYNSGRAHGIDGGVGYRVNLDARSNSEFGVVRSFVSLTGGTDQDHTYGADTSGSAYVNTGSSKTYARKAFIQIGGFTTGLKDSIADIAGSQGNIFTSGWNQSGVGMDYQVAVGGMNLGIGLEDSLKQKDNESERPDAIIHLSGKAGDVGFAFAGVSHDEAGDTGYAVLASANVKVGNVTVFGYAGMADELGSLYIGGSGDWLKGPSDKTDGDATSFGGGVTFALSNATSVTVQGVNFENDADNVTSYGVYVSHALAKNLTIQPEVVYTENNAGDVTSAFLRIQRDF